MPDARKTRVLIADDHRVVIDGVCSLIEGRSDMEVVGYALDGRAAIDAARSQQPDIVLLDVTMPNLNGIAAIRSILDVSNARVIGLSMHTSQRIIAETVLAGASGYVTKTCPSDEIIAAIHDVTQSRLYLSSDIDCPHIREMISKGTSHQETGFLTPREREVLQLIAEGKKTKEIAKILYLSEYTVNRHRVRIMDRLGIRSVAELTKYAVREGLSPSE